MTRSKWNGQTITTRTRAVIRRDGNTCWLCHHEVAHGSQSLDHVHPVSTHPHLEHEPTNWKLAHLTRAGTPTGCQHPACTCPGNKGRKAQPWTAPPSRSW